MHESVNGISKWVPETYTMKTVVWASPSGYGGVRNVGAVDTDPANKRRWANAGLMLGQRRRRWANINLALA